MRRRRELKLLLVVPAALIAGLVALLALAAGPDSSDVNASGLGGRQKPRPACKPNVSYIFVGPLTAVGVSSFTLDVSEANRHARSFVGREVPLNVNATTRIVREDERSQLAALEEGDALNVQVRDCKRSDPAQIVLLARRVEATPAPPPAPETETTPTESTPTTETAPEG